MQTLILKYTLSFLNFIGMKFVYDWHKNYKGKIIKNVGYADSSCKRQMLDIFVPEKQSGNLPIIIYFHGGGLMIGNKKDAYGTCKYLADQGYLVINVGYRLTPKYKFPTQLQDSAKAIYWVYKNAEKYGGDTSRIFLSGDSAGAYLASWHSTALHNESMYNSADISQIISKESLKGSLYFYGIFDWESVAKIKKFFKINLMAKSLFEGEIPDYSSPMKNISNNQTPVFISSSERDLIHEQSANYAKKLGEKEVSVKTLFFKKGNHGFLGHGYTDWCKEAVASAVKFIDSQA